MNTTNGVGLIEVMIAIVLISLTVGTIIGLQGRMLRRSITNARAIEYAIAVKNMYANARRYQGTNYPREKSLAELGLTLSYTREKPKPGSALSKIDSLMIERIETKEKVTKPYIRLMAQSSQATPS